MRRLAVLGLYVMLVAGCAHMEAPREGVYPFQARFRASGTIGGEDLDVEGALRLSSPRQGWLQVYGPMGLVALSAEIDGDRVVFKDTWGRATGSLELPLPDFAGVVAGDLPAGIVLWRNSCGGDTRLVTFWGWVCVDGEHLPSRLHTRGDPGLDMEISPRGGDVGVDVRLGENRMNVTLTPMEGGRWPRR